MLRTTCACERGAKQQAVFWGDVVGNRLRPDAIALLRQAHRPHDVDGDRALHPAGQSARVTGSEIVTARQHGDSRVRGTCTIQNQISQRPACVARDDDVCVKNLDVLQRAGDEGDAPGQPRPGLNQRLVQFRAGNRQGLVDDKRAWRRIVQQQHHLGEEAVSGAQIDDTAAAEEPPHPARHLQASYSSFRGRHPAWQTARARRSKSVLSGKRSRSRSVSRPRDEGENMRHGTPVALDLWRIMSTVKESPDPLRSQMVRLLEWEEGHVGFDKAVDALPADQRGSHATGFEHSPWQLLEHMRLAQKDLLDFCVNAEYVHALKWPDDYWPESAGPPGASAWNDSIADFKADREKLKQMIRDTGVDLFAAVPTGKEKQTYLRAILLVVDHNAYHLGQLVAVRRALGCWH